jgi:hypothetical protein
MRRGVGSIQTADHPRDKKYAEASIILFCFIFVSGARAAAALGGGPRAHVPRLQDAAQLLSAPLDQK